MDKSVMLVGLGPHAKRIYINLFKKHHITPKVIVDLDTNQEACLAYLKEIQFNESELYLVKREEADLRELSKEVQNDLKKLIKKHHIQYAIISTEPKAHFAYCKFFIENDINILLDKPITAPIDVLNTVEAAHLVEEEYLELCDLYKAHQDKMNFSIQCQRRFHIGYQYIRNLVKETVTKYQVPITYLDIYHSDGMWNMPNEFFLRENHPYKYGYGKLFHSGYHFVDIVAWLLNCNDSLEKHKVDNVDLFSTTIRPSDFFEVLNNDFYNKYLNTNDFKDILATPEKVKDFGELDFHSMINFKKNDKIITHCSFNLMQSGFTKRAWPTLPIDTYKANGRVRHERINIQIGPLMNIQLHSYQAHEINEPSDIPNYELGSLDHFDIYIFKNNNILPGKAFEKISINDLLEKSENDFLGNNEKARERCFLEFLNDKKNTSSLLDHQNGILLLSKLCESVANNNDRVSFKWRDYYE